MREVGVKKILWTEGPEVVDGKGLGFGEARVDDLWEEFLHDDAELMDSEWLTMAEKGRVQVIRDFAEREASGAGQARCCGSAGGRS